MAVEIKKCTCKSAFQDSEHGTGNRVCNETQKDSYRCTVCGHEIKKDVNNKRK